MKITIIVITVFLILAACFYWLFISYLEKLGNFQPVQLKVTIPEGYAIKDIADSFRAFKNFNRENFFKITESKEGYLFPDTYFFNGDETEEDVAKKMEENFKSKAGDAKPEIIIMASLLEKEVKTIEDKKIVSGILWKRLKVDMPLQVDAAPETYEHKGLTPLPICNPGLDSIQSALNPSESPYWYYLSDKQGNIHYAKTFEEHKINKEKYLR